MSVAFAVSALSLLVACSSDQPASPDGSAGSTGHAGSTALGGASGRAGATAGGAGGTSSLGGSNAGHAAGAGGGVTAGASAGGALAGSTATGGVASGGAAPGGAAGRGGRSVGGRGAAGGRGGTAGEGTAGVATGGTAGRGGASGGAGTSGGGAGGMPSRGPCDIYGADGNACVAAHSTVRALYAAYTGPLYQVRRASDKTTKDISVASGFADSAAQDAFCSGTTCTISILYDQSPKKNDLKVGPAGGAGKADVEANAAGLKLNVGGHSVYAVFIAAGMGYRDNDTSGIATGDEPEGMYMVTSGKHYNDGCCFDYGNAETNNTDTGNGHMEAIYFGNCSGWGKGTGSGPWVMADLENGLFAGQSLSTNSNNTPLTNDYVTAMVKGKAGAFAIRGGNAQSGMLKTMYDGARPTTSGYDPMHKEGAIILGIGGDNSNASAGTFFEGCITAGYPSATTEDAVQANIVAAGYGK